MFSESNTNRNLLILTYYETSYSLAPVLSGATCLCGKNNLSQHLLKQGNQLFHVCSFEASITSWVRGELVHFPATWMSRNHKKSPWLCGSDKALLGPVSPGCDQQFPHRQKWSFALCAKNPRNPANIQQRVNCSLTPALSVALLLSSAPRSACKNRTCNAGADIATASPTTLKCRVKGIKCLFFDYNELKTFLAS